MKRLSFTYFTIIALLGTLVFTSCSKDEDDVDLASVFTVTLSEKTGVVNAGEKATIGGTVVSDEKLVSIELLLNNAVVDIKEDFTTKKSDIFTFDYQTSEAQGGEEMNFSVVATDKDGRTVNADFALTVNALTTDLAAEQNFEFKRIGSADATGLDMFGLTWTSNTATAAVIKSGADKFVQLTAADYEEITTVEALMAKIDAADDMAKFEEISSVSETKDYTDIVLATKNGDNYFILKVENSAVVSDASGSTITITGVYKE